MTGTRARLALAFFVTLLVQVTIFVEVHPLGVAPELPLLVALHCGRAAGAERGASAGFVMGLLYDVQSPSPFGLWALTCCVAAYLMGNFSANLSRPTGLVVVWDTFNPFAGRPSYDAIAALGPAERLARLVDPAVRAAILAEGGDEPAGRMGLIAKLWHYVFPMLDGPTFEPTADESVAARASAAGVGNEEMLYDLMVQAPLQLSLGGYRKHDLGSIHDIMTHPHAMLGLADGGAHCSIICDSSLPSFVLQHWVRDRTRGPRIALEQAVWMMTARTAEIYDLADRGVLAPGRRADVNVIDLDAMTLHLPEVLHDLPTGAKRVVQRADGYDVTICNGEVTFRDATATGARPGVLVRGPQR